MNDLKAELRFTQLFAGLLLIFCLCLAVEIRSQGRTIASQVDAVEESWQSLRSDHAEHIGEAYDRIRNLRVEFRHFKSKFTPPEDPRPGDLPDPEDDPEFVLRKRLRFRIE